MTTSTANAPPPKPAQRVLLVDGSSYLYRAFHAMPDLRAVPGDSSSPATGAIRGMYNMLEALRREWPADYGAVVFDAPGKTFRDALYAEYKAQRSPMPDELRSQIAPIHELVTLLGWKMLCVSGVEADDVLGTLAQQAAQQGLEVVISSGDKDLVQLVTPQVMLVDTMSGKVRNEAGVLAEFGIMPQHMLEYQTLVGDAVDNVPGVEKVGPKTAVKWLQQYGSLAEIVAQADAIGGVVGRNLRKALPWLNTAQQLLKIRTDCDLQADVPGYPDLAALRVVAPDSAQQQALLQFAQRMGFASLSKKLQCTAMAGAHNAAPALCAAPHGTLPSSYAAPAQLGSVEALATATRLAPFVAHIVPDGTTLERILSAVDVDVAVVPLCQGEHPLQARLFGVALAFQDQALWLPLIHLPTTPLPLTAGCPLGAASDAPGAPVATPSLWQDGHVAANAEHARLAPAAIAMWAVFESWLRHSAQPDAAAFARAAASGQKVQGAKICHDAKWLQHVLANHGATLASPQHDVQLQSYVLAAHNAHTLARLAERWLGSPLIALTDLTGKGAKAKALQEVDAAALAQWGCQQAQALLQIHQRLWPMVQADAQLSAIYQLELATSASLWQMERYGVRVDNAALQRQSHALGLRIAQLEHEAHTLAGHAFNLGSPKQIGEIFFKELQYPAIKKTPKGEPSTDEEVLEKLAEDYPLPARILEHRGLAKLRNTYTDKLGLLIHPVTGRVHTHYAQAVAVTGRLSSSDPNLQNIPIRTPEGRRIRAAFIPQSGWRMLSADYSQIELRIMAHLSQDAALLKAFRESSDIHRATAAEILGIDPATVDSEQRRCAKVINFGLIYGMSAFGLAKALHLDASAAKNYMTRYFERYPGVQRYMEDTRALARAQGYVTTVFGRRLYLPEIKAPNGPRRAGAERAAINAPMQGTAADLIKLSMNAVHRWLHSQKLQSRMLLQVHDELVFEAPPEEVRTLRARIPQIMASVAQLDVPLVAEMGEGNNWDEAH